MSLILLFLSCAQGIAAEDEIALFKQFVENPPRMNRLFFQVEDRFHGRIETYSGKWQENASLVRMCGSSDEFTELTSKPRTGKYVCAFFANDWWYYLNDSAALWHDTGDPLEKSNTVAITVMLHTSPLWKVLSLGIESEPGKIRWQGDKFRHRHVWPQPVTAEGQIIRTNGRVAELIISYPDAKLFPKGYLRKIVYDYTTSFPGLEFLPGRWKAYSRRNEAGRQWNEIEDVQILAIGTQEAPLAKSEFSADQMEIWNPNHKVYVSGTNLIFTNPITQKAEMVLNQNSSIIKKTKRDAAFFSRVLYFFLAITIVGPFIVLLLKKSREKDDRNKPKPQNQKERID